MLNTAILAAATYLPATQVPMRVIEKRILDNSEGENLPVKAIQRLTGVQRVFHRAEGENTSDLAAAAGRLALERAGVKPAEVDLLLFASASQDLIEPATSHIVATQLGTTSPVFDVKNACNSFLNGLQVANSFIRQGIYNTILVVTGEAPSMAIRWNCRDRDEFFASFPGFTMSDSGGALLLRAVESDTPTGIISIDMTAHSALWEVGTLGMGGSRAPRDLDATYFNMNGGELFNAFKTIGCDMLFERVQSHKIDWADFAAIGMHQVAHLYNDMLITELGIPQAKAITTIKDYGNVASNSLPLQLEQALASGRIERGDRFAFIGLGGGISTGLGVFQL